MGMSDYVSKPIDQRELIAKMHALVFECGTDPSQVKPFRDLQPQVSGANFLS
jgi:DNA-binding response OmpR family regulator